jgi:putative transposase
VWSYDFVFYRCENGRQLKMLMVVDEFTRECLAIEVEHRMAAGAMARMLLLVMETRGRPEFVRSDNGPEFIAKALMRMLAGEGIKCRHIDPGSPWQNGKTERFNGTLRSECTELERSNHRDHARVICWLFMRKSNAGGRVRAWACGPHGVRAAAQTAGCRLLHIKGAATHRQPAGRVVFS